MSSSLCDQLAPLADAPFLSVGIETNDRSDQRPVETSKPAVEADVSAKPKAAPKAKTGAKPPKAKVSTKIKKVPSTSPTIAKVPSQKPPSAQPEVRTPVVAKAEPDIVASSTWRRVAVTIPESFRTRGVGAQRSLDLFIPMGGGRELRMQVTGLAEGFVTKRGNVLVGTVTLNDCHDGRHRYMAATLVLDQGHVLAQRKLIVHEEGERSAGWLFVHRLRTGGLFEIALPDGACPA